MKTIIISLCMIFNLAALAKGQDGGGAYAYDQTSKKHFESGKYYMSTEVLNVPAGSFRALGKEFGVNLTWEDQKFFSEVIKKAYPAYEEVAKDPITGHPKIMNYTYDEKNPKNSSIRVIKLFFETESFNKLTITQESQEEINRLLLQEASHTLNIGRFNNSDSINFSKKLKQLIKDTRWVCGANGTLEEKIENCKNKNSLPDWSIVSIQEKGKILRHTVAALEKIVTLVPKNSNTLISYYVLADSEKDHKAQAYKYEGACDHTIGLNQDEQWKLPSVEEVQALLPVLKEEYLLKRTTTMACLRTNQPGVGVCADGSQVSVRTYFNYNEWNFKIACISSSAN